MFLGAESPRLQAAAGHLKRWRGLSCNELSEGIRTTLTVLFQLPVCVSGWPLLLEAEKINNQKHN